MLYNYGCFSYLIAVIIRYKIPYIEDIVYTLNSLQLSVVCTMGNMKICLLREKYTLYTSNLNI